MFQGEPSAILSIFIKLSFVIKIFILSFLSGSFTQVLLYFRKSAVYRDKWVMTLLFIILSFFLLLFLRNTESTFLT